MSRLIRVINECAVLACEGDKLSPARKRQFLMSSKSASILGVQKYFKCVFILVVLCQTQDPAFKSSTSIFTQQPLRAVRVLLYNSKNIKCSTVDLRSLNCHFSMV